MLNNHGYFEYSGQTSELYLGAIATETKKRFLFREHSQRFKPSTVCVLVYVLKDRGCRGLIKISHKTRAESITVLCQILGKFVVLLKSA